MSNDDSEAPLVPGFAEVKVNENVHWLVQIVSEDRKQILATQVNKKGEVIGGSIVCSPDNIIRRMVLNTGTGELEPW